MKAMILAAGFGTRLKPLTEELPKALMPVANIPILERNIEYLNSFGITDIIINTHYLSESIHDFTTGKVYLTVRNEKEILGTGGGIANCRDFLGDDTFVVMNSDILTDIDINAAIKRHKKTGNLALMVLHNQEPFNQIIIDGNNNIKEIHREGPGKLAFTGIHVLEPEIFNHMPLEGFSDIILDCYNPLLASGKKITTHVVSGHYWYDIGTITSYIEANRYFLGPNKILKGSTTHIDPSADLREWAIIGDEVCIGEKAVIERSIIWNGTHIEDGTLVKDSIITPQFTVKK
ncbi:sugar phosphate nucleotidyltransferase [Thermodesulfobacteriota bacterium]